MDSTAVALLAHAAIAAGAGEPPLHTLSLTYQALPALARETPFLEAALGALAGVEAHRLPADALLDFDSFIDPPVHDEPYVGLWRLGMDRAMTRAAAGIGASTVLTGIGADELLDLQPFHITDLLRHGYLCEAWAEAARWARYDNCSRWGILYPFGIANVIPGWTERGLGRFLPVPGRSRHVMQGDWTVSPWIRPDFARKYDLRARAAAHARSTYGLISSAALSFAVDSIKSRTGDVTRWCVAAPLGLTVTHPFLDTRLLRYGLGMQARLRPEPGRLKPVLGEGMRGLLPEAIRYRARKGTFNEVYYLGLSRNLPYLLAMIDRAPIDDLDIVDKAILSRSLREAALGGAHVRQLHRLNLTLSLVRWLLMQEKRHQAITAFPARCERRQG
jgi:asparagine synthase (glutamine-hydrolysing)